MLYSSHLTTKGIARRTEVEAKGIHKHMERLLSEPHSIPPDATRKHRWFLKEAPRFFSPTPPNITINTCRN